MDLTLGDIPHVLWSTELAQPPIGQPLAISDLLLVPTQEPGLPAYHTTLYALSMADGSLRWRFPFEYALISGLQAFKTSILVSTTSTDLMRGEGALIALDAAGQERWRWAPGVQQVSAPAVAGNSVCVVTDAQSFVVLDADTGIEQVRTSLNASASLAAPATASILGEGLNESRGKAEEGSVAYVPCRGPHLLAVGFDGQLRWRFDAADSADIWIDKTPVIVGDRVFAVLAAGAVVALVAKDGSLVWRIPTGPTGKSLSQPATDGTRLFVGARDGLHALGLDDGRKVWYYSTERQVTAAPIVDGGVVYVACHDHCLYALDTATGRELWRYEAKRQIEVPAIVVTCGKSRISCVLIADRGGALVAIARPLGVEDYKASGRWTDAASVYAARGQFVRGAKLLEAHGESAKAAEMWEAAGEQERAAKQYEAAEAWQQAAEIWAALGSPRQAEALALHARSLSDQPCSDRDRADAWAAAAQAFEAEGDVQRAVACRRENARWREQPILTLAVQHDGLVLNAWSRLQFTVRNEGYGPACHLVIRASGDEFEGQVMTTRQIFTLRAGRERTDCLDVRPLEYGEAVPLRVSVEYDNLEGEVCVSSQTIYIPVARAEADRGAGQVFRIDSGGGAVILGDVEIEGGNFVGRDTATQKDDPLP